MIDENDVAVATDSDEIPCQAAAACSIGAEPAPLHIRQELISGGGTAILTILTSYPGPRLPPEAIVARSCGSQRCSRPRRGGLSIVS
ncbi:MULTISPECIES: hypothetical protein [Mycobacterium]|uniref:Uncharacterized protein n=1 Tax=Mycobacterium persicum TaxID=1487726 RepID=A0AB38UZF7_9MYCO|nr:hypothetical protein A4G31_10895 [Mycobacterium persicum]VAZ80237.1 hypothetical protein LAUMK15_05290 [Mycobacterium persicum]VAZ86120.1 hypothetical protein LAUMK42_04963 [Mycobacterium persicum]VBA30168.1 hypothetical protein LAUMK4_04990 [Mycobacterium persicum]